MILGHTGEGFGPGDPMGDVNQFLSQHGQGAHFLFGDGHVRFLQRVDGLPDLQGPEHPGREGGDLR